VEEKRRKKQDVYKMKTKSRNCRHVLDVLLVHEVGERVRCLFQIVEEMLIVGVDLLDHVLVSVGWDRFRRRGEKRRRRRRRNLNYWCRCWCRCCNLLDAAGSVFV